MASKLNYFCVCFCKGKKSKIKKGVQAGVLEFRRAKSSIDKATKPIKSLKYEREESLTTTDFLSFVVFKYGGPYKQKRLKYRDLHNMSTVLYE